MYYAELRKRMKERNVKQDDLCGVLGLESQPNVSHRFSRKKAWTIAEMYAVMDYLKIPYAQLHIYFPKAGIAYVPPPEPKRKKMSPATLKLAEAIQQIMGDGGEI